MKIKKQFFQSLKNGTGRAYIILKENPDIDFDKEIIKGAIKNYAYDAQCEGSRAEYIHKLIRKSKNPGKIENQVLERVVIETEDYYGLQQMCDLAVLFHKAGSVKAKEALNKRFRVNLIEDTEFAGQEQLMEVEGVAGVLRVAKLIGKYLYENKDDCEYSWNIDQFQKKNKQVDIYEILSKKAKRNKYIKTYLESILATKGKAYKREKVKRFSYEIVKQRIDANRFMIISSNRANELSDAEVEKLANDFLAEKNNSVKEMYLRFFSKRKYPKDITPLVKIVSKRNPSKTHLVRFAAKSLKFFNSRKIRKIAIEKIKSVKNPSDFLPLLTSNYRKGDYKLLLEVLGRSKNQEFIHSMAMELVRIYNNKNTKDCKEPLERIYELMTCSICRNDILEIMYKNDVLEESIWNEMKFDSAEDTRKLYRKIKKQQVQ